MTKINDYLIIEQAIQVLENRMSYKSDMVITNPDDVKNFVKLQIGTELQEIFAVLFLDNRHRLISFDKLFYGTIDSASVYPREIIRKALEHNAAALILTHNHPSGESSPSTADKQITDKIKQAASLFDIRLLDHLVVGQTVSSMAEQGTI